MDWHMKKYGCTMGELGEYTGKPAVHTSTDTSNPAGYRHRSLSLTDNMPYGKYKGQTIKSLIDYDLDYIVWFYNLENITLDDDVSDAIDFAISERKD
jgi:hypothetical protein